MTFGTLLLTLPPAAVLGINITLLSRNILRVPHIMEARQSVTVESSATVLWYSPQSYPENELTALCYSMINQVCCAYFW